MEVGAIKKNTFLEFLKLIIITAVIVIPFRLWVAQPFIVSGASMEPTYYNGDYLIVNELGYHFNEPQKDEIIIFRYPLDQSKFFIKRITGIPEETMSMRGGKKITLGENEYFVVGDNTSASSDSRIWGSVPRENIIGKVFVKLWSSNKIISAFLSIKSFITQ